MKQPKRKKQWRTKTDPNRDIPERNLKLSAGPFRELSAFPKGVRVQRPNLQTSLKGKAEWGWQEGGVSAKSGIPHGSANRSVWKCPEKKGRGCVCFNFSCVRVSPGTAVCWPARRYCNPRLLKNPIRLWHMHTGSVPQKCTHRRAATTDP